MKELFYKSNIANIIDFYIELYHFCVQYNIQLDKDYNPTYMKKSFDTVTFYGNKIVSSFTNEQRDLFLKCMRGDILYQRVTSGKTYISSSYWHDFDIFS